MKYNADNERIKRKYFVFMKEAKRLSESSIDGIAKAIKRFEEYNKFRSFQAFHFEQAVGFKKHLKKQRNLQTGNELSKATLNSTMRHLKAFFQWLAMQSGYKSRINYSDAEYFNLSEKEVRVATAKREKLFPTIEQIVYAINTMPSETVLERRNRCLLAFTLATGARDSAIASLKLNHIDLTTGCVYQDARDVNTKFSKTFKTYFFPVGDDVLQIIHDWVNYLRKERMWGNEDPLFPKTKVALGEKNTFEAVDVDREHWSNASPIRSIFKTAFESAGLPYFNPHSFRDTLVDLGGKVCKGLEALKAWSQNLGHEKILTTYLEYGGTVQPRRQAEIIQGLTDSGDVPEPFDTAELAKAVAREISLQQAKIAGK